MSLVEVPFDLPGGAGAIVEGAGPPVTVVVRRLSDRFRAAVTGVPPDPARAQASCQRSQPGSATLIERAICLRDLLHATGDRLERLAQDASPVQARLVTYESIAGYHRWDPEEVLAAFAAEADRVARIAAQLGADERLPVGIRRGLEAITTGLLDDLIRQAEGQLRDGAVHTP